MGELREKMLRRIELKNLSKKTVKLYLWHMEKYVRYYGKSPDKLGKEEIERYRHYLITKKTSGSGMAQAYSALKFFYSVCLERPWELEKIPRPKTAKRLPVVLSPEEVKSILRCVKNRKHRIVLMTIYSAGLRLSEALKLKIEDIDSKRMAIRIEQGKGKSKGSIGKDRYTLLSNILLKNLRKYYIEEKPKNYIFPGKYDKPISGSTIQRVFGKAKKKHISQKMLRYTPCAIVLPHIF